MEPEPPAGKVLPDAVPPRAKLLGVVVEHREVVDVAQIAPRPQDFLAEMIQPVEVHVGEELAGEIPDRQAAAPFEGRQQGVAGKEQQDGLLGVRPVDDRSSSPSVRPQAIRRRRSILRMAWSMAGK